MRVILTLLLSLFLSGASSAPKIDAVIVPAGEEAQHAATHHIEMATPAHHGDSCSATAVGPHALLTAQHCILGTDQISVDGVPTEITATLYDRSEHVILVVKQSFPAWASLDERDPHPAEMVHLWGNPGHSRDVFRVGMFQKFDSFDGEDGDTYQLQVFVLPIYAGDSGSAVFSEDGKVIAVVSLGNQSADAACLPLKFTPEQIRSVAS